MIPAWSLKEIVRVLTQAFESRYPSGNTHLVGLLFSPPESSLGKSEIVESLDYFHHRSEDNIDFFCAGYRKYGEAKHENIVVERRITSDTTPWYFNVIEFEALRKEVQKHSLWKYSGEADLILVNATINESDQDPVLDWSSAICCDLEGMKKDKAIESVRRFFEAIFIFVDKYDGTDPVRDFSDQQGINKAKSGLMRLIFSLLPKPLQDVYSESKHLVIRDIARGARPPYLLTDLRRNGDFIVVVEHLLRSIDEELPEDLTEIKLSEQLDNLLFIAEIRAGASFEENVFAIAEHPIVSLRAAVVAVRLVRKIRTHSPQKTLSLNLLRRDILFGVTGIDQKLEKNAIKRCTSDYERIAWCLAGALSDVASSFTGIEKKKAIESYSRFCAAMT